MSLEDTADLVKFLKPYPEHISQLALWLREFVWKLYPDSNELIYDNYQTVAFGFAVSDRLSDTFCSIAPMSTKYVHFGFYWGTKLTDPGKILEGKGNQYRYIKVYNKDDFPKTAIKNLIKEARLNALMGLKDGKQILKGATITKSISPVKKRPK
jgi:hypothetical protein